MIFGGGKKTTTPQFGHVGSVWEALGLQLGDHWGFFFGFDPPSSACQNAHVSAPYFVQADYLQAPTMHGTKGRLETVDPMRYKTCRMCFLPRSKWSVEKFLISRWPWWTSWIHLSWSSLWLSSWSHKAEFLHLRNKANRRFFLIEVPLDHNSKIFKVCSALQLKKMLTPRATILFIYVGCRTCGCWPSKGPFCSSSFDVKSITQDFYKWTMMPVIRTLEKATGRAASSVTAFGIWEKHCLEARPWVKAPKNEAEPTLVRRAKRKKP